MFNALILMLMFLGLDYYTWMLICVTLFGLVVVPWAFMDHYRLTKKLKEDKNKECDYGYYDVRAGKCQWGDVYSGRIICKNPNCRDYKGRNEGGNGN